MKFRAIVTYTCIRCLVIQDESYMIPYIYHILDLHNYTVLALKIAMFLPD